MRSITYISSLNLSQFGMKFVQICTTKLEVPVSISGRVLGNFQVACSYCPHFEAMWSTQPLTEMNAKGLPWGKAWPTLRAESSAVWLCQMSESGFPLPSFYRKIYIQVIFRTVLFLKLQACTALHSKSH
jgi:hypothetical protein